MLSRVIKILLYWAIALLQWLFPAKLDVTKITLKINDLSHPVKVVHISDIHYDLPHAFKRITPQLLDQTISIANDANADLIVITGDFVQFAPEPAEQLAKKWLNKLKAKYGVYGVMGNHDLKVGHGKEYITEQLAKANIKILDNQVDFPMGEHPGALLLVGFCDYTRKQLRLEPVEDYMQDSTRPKLVLSHNPDSAELLRKYRADVILAGHTHGGQVLLPWIGSPLPLIRKLLPQRLRRYLPGGQVIRNWEWLKGLHEVPREGACDNPFDTGNGYGKGNGRVNYLYVNRGLATHPPMRLNCNPEITILDLIPNK